MLCCVVSYMSVSILLKCLNFMKSIDKEKFHIFLSFFFFFSFFWCVVVDSNEMNDITLCDRIFEILCEIFGVYS